MTELSIFNFEGQEIRVCGSAENPEWVAADVGAVLGLNQSTVRHRLSNMPDSWKGVYSIHTLGGMQQMNTVTEPGLYELIFRSDKPAAQRFRVWVFEEVLPSIRRTGSYSHPNADRTESQVSQLIELAQFQAQTIGDQLQAFKEQQKLLTAALATLSKVKKKDKKQPNWTPRTSSHLLEFMRDAGLEAHPDAQIFIIDLWQELLNWYVKAGVLRIKTTQGERDLIWSDLPNERDTPIKAINQVYRRFQEVFPKIKKRQHTQRQEIAPRGRYYLCGIGRVEVYCEGESND